MDNEQHLSREIWRLAMLGYLATAKPEQRPDPKQDEMFAAFVRGNPQHQSWRYLKQFIDNEAGLTGTISFAKVMHQLRDSRIASRVQKLSLEEMAAETNRAVNAKREAADAYKHFLNLLGGSNEARRETGSVRQDGDARPTNSSAVPEAGKPGDVAGEGPDRPNDNEESAQASGVSGVVRRRRKAGASKARCGASSEVSNA